MCFPSVSPGYNCYSIGYAKEQCYGSDAHHQMSWFLQQPEMEHKQMPGNRWGSCDQLCSNILGFCMHIYIYIIYVCVYDLTP